MSNIVSSMINLKQIATLSQLTLVRQIGFMFVVAAGIALGTSIVLWSTSSNYVALFLDMSTQDSADVISALQDSNIEYRMDASTGIISVPAERIQETKLMMASRGLPSSSSLRGYAVLEEEQGLGTSNFMEQARYHRALEQELVETIRHIQIVRNARVHLSIPKQTSFLRSVNKPSASVMIELIGLQGLSDSQLNGILHLVTSSVAGMEPSSVSIVDQRGNLLSQNIDSNLGNSNENIRLTRQFEQDYSNRITTILTPMVGTGNVRTQVSADLDFTFIETTEETYNPNNVVVRSEQTQEESSGSNTSPIEPGSLSALPSLTDVQQNPLESSSGNNQTRTNTTRNYEIDRSVSLIRRVPGTVRKLSVAVLVDLHGSETTEAALDEDPAAVAASLELDALKIERITQLVQEAIGFDAARGDTVRVIHESFVADAEILPVAPLAFWQQEWFFSTVKQVAAGLGVIFLIFGVLRPAMQLTLTSPPANSSVTALQSAGGVELTGEHIQASANGESGSVPALGNNGRSSYDQNLTEAQSLVQNEPARAARMIQNWLTNE
ncbi:MAG: flagellar M-ring protein FliF [SAR86 cluster bacterium]|uniref:Flagellar M-ring protein n=1 Tax=SAR86 cluster bacterium TaxID=2030880 RepID=A0A2A4XH54_9GAMM|nr:MAG: flagellar M-ring protein FliF [SAR86 cluster bacterium]